MSYASEPQPQSNKGKCVLVWEWKYYTHVEILTGNSWEKFINYRSSGRNRTHPQPVRRHYHPKYTLITLAPVRNMCIIFPLDTKTHLPFRKFSTSSEVPQNPNDLQSNKANRSFDFASKWRVIIVQKICMNDWWSCDDERMIEQLNSSVRISKFFRWLPHAWFNCNLSQNASFGCAVESPNWLVCLQ